MALTRRSGQRFATNIWPGFVDALTALLLILMFVLSIFMIVQFSLRETITGQSKRLSDLNAQLSALTDVLALERTRSEEAESELVSVRANLIDQTAETDRLSAALAALSEQKAVLEVELSEAQDALNKEIDAREAVNLALAKAREEVDAEAEKARLAAARREALQAMIQELNDQAATREEDIVTLNADKASALALIAALQTEAQAREDALAAGSTQVAELEAAQQALADEKRALLQTQAQLRREISRLSAQKAMLESDLDTANRQLSNEEEARLLEAAAAQALRKKLAEDAAELDAVTLALEEARREAEQTLTLLAAAEAAKQRLADELNVKTEDLAGIQLKIDEAERQRQTLEQSTEAFDREAALRKLAEAELAKATAQTAEQARRVALLNAQVKQLNDQLGQLQQVLDETAEKEAAGKIQISNLGTQLNAALARKVALEVENAELLADKVDELEQVRSIFLERVEGALAGRDGVKRVGDRFVFQSEVLFRPGSAELGLAGQRELTKLGAVMRELERELPEDFDWILRVDGHTDPIPLTGAGRYRNNWELSQARALSVVSYLINREGVDPSRLAAAGFGEFQPIDAGDTPEALERNRRIEFKFTQR
ncbi:MAG: peptidoglycan -binding protein [Pseudomonadota bacterium]